MATLTAVLDDDIGLSETYGPNGYGVFPVDTIGLTDAYGHTGYGVNPKETIGFEELYFGYTYIAGVVLDEIVRVNSPLIASGVYSPVLVDTINFVTQLLRVLPVTVTDGMSVHDALTIARGAVLMEKIGFKETFIFSHLMGLTLSDAVSFADGVLSFFGRSSSESLSFSDVFDAQFVFGSTLTETLGLSAQVTSGSLFMRTVDEDFGFDDEMAIQSIFNSAIIDDNICFSIGLIDPGGGFTTWVVNTRTQAVTEYSNYNFNSFLSIGNEYYGLNSDGLWLLNAQTDDGDNIVSSIKGAMLALGGSRFSQLDGVYLGVRVDTNARSWVLKLIVPRAGVGGGPKEFFYQFRPRDMETTRVNIGKGFRYRYFQWEIITDGADFDLDAIEFVPVISKRRVR